MSKENIDWKQFLNKYGYYAVDFSLNSMQRPSLNQLKEWMRTDEPRYTGWSPFWWPTRKEIAPQVIDQDTFECIHDGTGPVNHIERWQASTEGRFTIVRAYDVDEEEPGKYFDLTLPAWRVAEMLLYAGRMADRFESRTVDFTLRYEGLAGRMLQTRAAPNRFLSGNYTTKAIKYEKRLSLSTEDIDSGVIEMTDNLVRNLFELFQLTLPATLCEEEITRMRTSRF